MTAAIDTLPADTLPADLEPGWLLRTWSRHVADAEPPPPARHAYMCSPTLAATLEPFVIPPEPLDDAHSHLFLRFDGVDATAATALLRELPAIALQRCYSTYAPSPRKMLTAVARGGGTLTCGGDLASPALATGGIRLWSLTVHDATLLDAEPDLVPGELPTWLDALAPEARLAYLSDREECLDHGARRQAWIRIATRYGIGGARRLPTVETLIGADGEPSGVRFLW